MMRWLLSKPPMTVQTEALRHSEGRLGYNWWMEVGLGKTWTELNEWANDYDDGTADFHVVVALNSFKRTWLDEIDLTGGNSKDYTLWEASRSYDADKLTKGKLGVVMNWESLIAKGGKTLEEIVKQGRKVRFCLDEGHRVKNPSTKVSRFVMRYWKDTPRRRSLTGTPMDNSVLDMFVPLKLGEQINGMNQVVFRNRYAIMGGYLGKIAVGIKQDMLPELHALRDQAGFVATKKEWLPGLPDQRWVTPIRTPLDSVLKKIYTDMSRDFYVMLGDEAITANMIITQLLRLQQISSGFATSEGGDTLTLLPINQSEKYKALLDLIEMRGGSKLLVFTHFVWTTTELYLALRQELGPDAVAVMRSQAHGYLGEAEEEKRRFNSDDACKVMVAQSTVASESHTLLGTPTCVCHGSVFYENTYVLRTRMQAEGRNHRKGQTLPVDYYDFVSSPVEEKVVRALQQKLDLVRSVMTLQKETA